MNTIAIVLVLISLISASSVAYSASVILDREEFVKMLSNVDAIKSNLALADQQVLLYKKSTSDRMKVIELQKEEIAQLQSIIVDHGKVKESQDKLIESLNAKLDEVESSRKYWIAGTSASVLVAIVAVIFSIIK